MLKLKHIILYIYSNKTRIVDDFVSCYNLTKKERADSDCQVFIIVIAYLAYSIIAFWSSLFEELMGVKGRPISKTFF